MENNTGNIREIAQYGARAGAKREPMSNYEAMAYLLMTLRRESSIQRALSIRQIQGLCDLSMSEKKIRSCLRRYLELQNGYKSDMFRYHNRGLLRTVGREKGIRYYWDDLLSDREREMYEREVYSFGISGY